MSDFMTEYMNDVSYSADIFWKRDLGLLPRTSSAPLSCFVCCDSMKTCVDDSVYEHLFYDDDFCLNINNY